ncbi:hypothetical protein UlMin_000712 [Ulmus minor]
MANSIVWTCDCWLKLCFQRLIWGRNGKSIECKESRIGKQPIEMPKNVTITLEGQDMKVKEVLVYVLRLQFSVSYMPISLLLRTLTDNMLVGVSKGFKKRLQLVGVGYRAMLEGQILVLSLGFSHPVRMEILDGIKVKVEDNTRIVVSRSDKSGIGQFAASIGKWRPPKPCKGKGVKYVDENIRRKEGNTRKKK